MSLKTEILVAKPMLVMKFPNDTDLSTVLSEHLLEYKEVFSELCKLYAGALVIGVSSASCESSSTQLRVLNP